MELGIFAKTFSRPSVHEVFKAVASHHLAQIQFNFACARLPTLPSQIPPDVVNQIKAALHQHQLRMAALSGTFNLAHPDPQHRSDGLKRLKILASVCPSLGCNLITLCTGTCDPHDMWKAHPNNSSPEAWRTLLSSLESAIAIAHDNQLFLGIEPELNNIVDSAHAAVRLLRELQAPELKIVIDPANLVRPGEASRTHPIMDEAFDLLGPQIVLAHAKDMLDQDPILHVAPGQGQLDYPAYIEHLDAIGYRGPLILHGLDESEITTSLLFLRNLIPSPRETSGSKLN